MNAIECRHAELVSASQLMLQNLKQVQVDETMLYYY